MRAFACFIVVSHDGLASLAAVKPKLQLLRPIRRDVRQLPHGPLDDAAIGENRLGVQNQSCLDDGTLYHKKLVGKSRANVTLPAPWGGPQSSTSCFRADMRPMKSRRWWYGGCHGSHVVARSLISISCPRAVVVLVVGRSPTVNPSRRLRKDGR